MGWQVVLCVSPSTWGKGVGNGMVGSDWTVKNLKLLDHVLKTLDFILCGQWRVIWGILQWDGCFLRFALRKHSLCLRGRLQCEHGSAASPGASVAAREMGWSQNDGRREQAGLRWRLLRSTVDWTWRWKRLKHYFSFWFAHVMHSAAVKWSAEAGRGNQCKTLSRWQHSTANVMY